MVGQNSDSNKDGGKPLSHGIHGNRGVITAISGSEPLCQRLSTLGIRPGLEIRIVRRAPFQGPLEVAVRNIHLGLRYEDAACILVRAAEDTL